MCIFTVADGQDAAPCESKEKVSLSLLGESYSEAARGAGQGVDDVAGTFRAVKPCPGLTFSRTWFAPRHKFKSTHVNLFLKMTKTYTHIKKKYIYRHNFIYLYSVL